MDGGNGETVPGCFALVSYLPQPLADFLDSLRSDLAQESHAKAHVTVLPPRAILCPAEQAWQELEINLQEFEPFCVELSEIEIFSETQVIYLAVGLGYPELARLHDALNSEHLRFDEPFKYHPHVTVAKEMEPEFRAAAAETAARRWQEFPHSRRFTVDRVTFVQNTRENRWIDLHSCRLAARVST